MVIESKDNKKIKEIRKLSQKKYRDKEKKFIVEGEHLVLEAYKSGYLNELILEDAKTYSEKIDNIVKNHQKDISYIDGADHGYHNKETKLANEIIKFGDKSDELARKIENERQITQKDLEKAARYKAVCEDIENTFQGFFGTKVKVEAGKRKGKIVIEYSNNNELERILGLIK